MIGGGFAFLLGAAAVAAANAAASTSDARPDLTRLFQLFGRSLTIVDQRYVVPVDNRPLLGSAIKGMLTSLDPHSDYLSPDDLGQAGGAAGVGLTLASENGAVRVLAPADGGPAAAAGVRDGDRIIAIDGRALAAAPLGNAIKALRGAEGSRVVLTIKRPAQPSFDLALVRRPLTSDTAKGRLEGDYGLVRVSSFDAGTPDQVAKALGTLKQANPRMKGLVLDLRDNPGGLLAGAVGVASRFLDGGEIASQQGRAPADTEHFNAQPGGDLAHGLPVVVLINGGTASGAELVAAALQDRRRATLVGLTSFGMGTIQTVIPLQGYRAGAIKLTTSRIFSPSGRSFQVVGVSPDIEVAANALEARRAADPAFAFSEANMLTALDVSHGEARRAAARHPVAGPPEGFSPKADYQLARAIEVLGGGQAARPGR